MTRPAKVTPANGGLLAILGTAGADHLAVPAFLLVAVVPAVARKAHTVVFAHRGAILALGDTNVAPVTLYFLQLVVVFACTELLELALFATMLLVAEAFVAYRVQRTSAVARRCKKPQS